MTDTKRNALAKLAVRLGTDALSLGADRYPEIEAAQRIVAELAKIEYSACGSPENPLFAMKRLDNCRAIAEEGVTNV